MRRLDLELIATDGKKKVKLADETKYLMGGIEGPWWRNYSWWVVPSGLTLLLTPWFILSILVAILILGFYTGNLDLTAHHRSLSSAEKSVEPKEDETVYRSTIVLLEGETDDEETYRSTIHLPQ